MNQCTCRRETDGSELTCEFCDTRDDDALWQCSTCRGRGTVNPLTAPDDFFCVGTTSCPRCDGTGEING